jgi:Cu-processing system permease protein
VKKIWILARMTFLEAIRRKIVLTALILGILFLIIFSIGFRMISTEVANDGLTRPGVMARVMQNEMSSFMLNAGLYAVAFLSVAMGALLSADSLAGEISSGTIQTILTKPIRRSDVVLGKWLGFAALLALYLLLMAGGTVLIAYITSGYLPPNVLKALSLMYLEALLVMTFSLACSSTMPALATGGTVFGLYGLAFIGGWIEQIGAIFNNQTAVRVGIVTSLLFPTEAIWRRATFEMQSALATVLEISPFTTTSVPSQIMMFYALLYLVVTLTVAIRIFQNRDI